MRRFIFAQRNGIHIVDLQQTMELLEQACTFATEVAASGKRILMVGTKKQAQESVKEEAIRAGQYYINQRWLGGTITNFTTIQTRIDHLVNLEERKTRGEFSRLLKKEALKLDARIEKLNRYLGGIKDMTSLPGALFIVDVGRENIAVAEAPPRRYPHHCPRRHRLRPLGYRLADPRQRRRDSLHQAHLRPHRPLSTGGPQRVARVPRRLQPGRGRTGGAGDHP